MHCICNAIVRYLTELTVNQDESKAKRANLQGNRRILKWWPFLNKVYAVRFLDQSLRVAKQI